MNVLDSFVEKLEHIEYVIGICAECEISHAGDALLRQHYLTLTLTEVYERRARMELFYGDTYTKTNMNYKKFREDITNIGVDAAKEKYIPEYKEQLKKYKGVN